MGAADVMDKHQRSNVEIEMAGQQQFELSHKVRDRVRLMQWDVLNVSLKHRQDVEHEGFKAGCGVLSSGGSNPD